MNTTWNPDHYLKFQKERTQPAIDLANRVKDEEGSIESILDVGCGSGISTEVLFKRWPDVAICGIDSCKDKYNKQQNGKLIFPFRRLFFLVRV